jgi:hypothetical protein
MHFAGYPNRDMMAAASAQVRTHAEPLTLSIPGKPAVY